MPPVLLSGHATRRLSRPTQALSSLRISDIRAANSNCSRTARRMNGCSRALGLRLVQIGIQPLQLRIVDQPSLASFRKLWNMAAGVRSVRAQAPDLGHVEHLADRREH